MKVIVATDGTEAAIDAAHRAIELFRPEAKIVLVTVILDREDPMESAGGFEGPLQTEEEADEDYAEQVAAGNTALEHTASAVGDGVEVKLISADEHPGPAIVHLAEQLHPDVIVIGAAGKGPLKRLLRGSVSDHVVHHAPCPVLVVRHHD
jgi:nucleotide-binding universal stress UspA family protein